MYINQLVEGVAHDRTFFFFGLFVFLGLHWWHMEVPRLGVESEL